MKVHFRKIIQNHKKQLYLTKCRDPSMNSFLLDDKHCYQRCLGRGDLGPPIFDINQHRQKL